MGLPSAKCEIIHEIISRPDNKLKLAALCRIAGVARSSYYNWVNDTELRLKHEEQERKDFNTILEAYNYKGYKKGARSIYMRILHMPDTAKMNLKKIRRLMKKFDLVCPIRKANPYKRIAKAVRTSTVADNLLKREFRSYGLRRVLLTDITYIPLNDRFFYLSTILDAYTKQVLSYVLSDSLEVDFVLETVNKAILQYGKELSDSTIIHSDQGVHYTSYKFVQLIKDSHLRQSMSRRGNCWDNAPQESFYGHMKDEIDIGKCFDYSSLKDEIDRYMDYYNNDRYQWELCKLSPNEYYNYKKTGIYPLEG